MSAALLLYAIAGTLALSLMVAAIIWEVWHWREDPELPDWYAAALAVTFGLALLGALAP